MHRSRLLGAMLAASAAALAAPAAASAASLVLDPGAAPPGATIAVSGGGFGGSCGVRLQWEGPDGGLLEVAGHAEASGGAFASEIVVPEARLSGPYVVRARGLGVDAAGRCAAPNGLDATALLTLQPAPPPPVADLQVSSTTVSPGGVVKLDASGSSGAIEFFQFDLDGNGSYETKCGTAAAGSVVTTVGSKPVGVQAVGTGGAKSSDQVMVNFTGPPASPPPKPGGGGNFAPIGGGGGAGTCGTSGESVSDFLSKAYTCPGTVFVGVATFAKPLQAPADQCFERIENGLLSHWRAKSKIVLVNGLRLDTLDDYLSVYDLFKHARIDRPQGDNDAKFKVSQPGFDTVVGSGIFYPKWDVSKPGPVGVVPIVQPLGLGSFLGLPYATKDTQLRLTGSGGAEFDLFLELPLPKVLFDSNASSDSLTVRVNATDGIEFESGYTVNINDVYAGLFTLKNISVTYQRQGSSDFWGGGLSLAFPASGIEASGQVGVRDGVLESLSASINPGPPGIGPIGCCVFIVQFGGQLTNSSIAADASFSAGPQIVGDSRAGQAHGKATIFYEPFEFLLQVDDVRIVNIPVGVKGDASITLDSFSVNGQLNKGFGPFSVNAGVGAKVGNGYWGASGSGDGCIDVIIDACVGVKVAVGPKGVAGCGKISIKWLPDPAGGAVVYWGGGFSSYWGCSMGKVKGKAGAAAIAAARAAHPDAGTSARPFSVRVPRGLNRALFEVRGAGGPPQVRLKGPGVGAVTTPPPGVSTAQGARWFATRATADNTTYVIFRRPPGGKWKLSELPGSPAIASVGVARGLPARIARGRVTGKGRSRTLAYRVAKLPGTRVTFFERGGPEIPAAPGESVDRVIGAARRASGRIPFKPAESRTRARRIDAVIESDGATVRTETVARFRSPRFGRLPAPKLRLIRKGSSLLVRWSRIRAAQRYRAVVDLSDRATLGFETSRKRRGLRIAEIGPLTSGKVEVRAISPGGYLGRGGKGALRRVPPLRADRRLTVAEVRRAKGVAARCTASAVGVCVVEVRSGSKLLASGSRAVGFGQTVRVLAKLTKAGKRTLRKGGVRATLSADVPGESTAPLRVRIVKPAKKGKTKKGKTKKG
ncbi:MAG: hypothetical protein ACXWGV_05840 [Solirubrobacterales bacterium]